MSRTATSNYVDCVTLTFGEVAENHVGMQKLGDRALEGFTPAELQAIQVRLKKRGVACELIELDRVLSEENSTSTVEVPGAAVLVIRSGVNALLSASDAGGATALYAEQKGLHPDQQALMYGRVVNKHARYNLCFDEVAQVADIGRGKGTVVPFSSVPLTQQLRNVLEELFGAKASDLKCEGNYYYDANKCGIGFHGDSERKIVIAARLGAAIPLHFQWFLQGRPVGERTELVLNHGDMYIMSEKATGCDWKKKTIYTLRHAAGAEKYLRIVGAAARKAREEKKEDGEDDESITTKASKKRKSNR